MLFAIPFLALGLVVFEDKYKKKFKHFPDLTKIAIAFSIAFCFLGFYAAPTQTQFDTINQAYVLSEELDIPIYNDWKYGWWIIYNGYDTNFKASYPNPDYNNLQKPFVALTSKDLNCQYIDYNEPAIFICR
jgi:hypothetical protein